jgi:hypothetical protein
MTQLDHSLNADAPEPLPMRAPESFLDHALSAPEASKSVRSQAEACPTCRASREPQWVFCGGCGGRLPTLSGYRHADDSDDEPTESQAEEATGHADHGTVLQQTRLAASQPTSLADAGPKPATATTAQRTDEQPTRRRRPRTILAVAAACLIIIGVAALGTAGWMKWNSTQDELAATHDKLDATRAQLAFANDTLDTTRNDLKETTGTLRSTQGELSDARGHLNHTRGSLDHAQDRLDLQAGQIDSLQNCLGGVADALSSSAGGYYSDAIASLDAVQGDCEKSDDIL